MSMNAQFLKVCEFIALVDEAPNELERHAYLSRARVMGVPEAKKLGALP